LDHHPASLSWKVIDLAAERHHHQSHRRHQQKQVVNLSPWRWPQSEHNADSGGRRRYVGELFI